MPDWLRALLTSGQVWSAFLLLVNTLLFYFWPQFPREIWASINGFVIAILGVMGVSVAKDKVMELRIRRELRETKAQ